MTNPAEKSVTAAAPSKPSTKRRRFAVVAILAVVILAVFAFTHFRAQRVVLTGIVTTDTAIVGAEVGGRIAKLAVQPGDTVKAGDLIALIAPMEWQADMAYYENTTRSLEAQVAAAESELKMQEQLSNQQIKQAEANVAAAEAQVVAAKADLENAQLTFNREKELNEKGAEPVQAFDQARAVFDSAKAHADAFVQQVQASRATLEVARANAAQVDVKRAALDSMRKQLAAAVAQKDKAQVRLGYTEVRAPIAGVVDVRAALVGEVVNAAQPIVTLINPDDLWVRADVEESFIDRIHLGDKLNVRLPSGATREGTVIFRGVDADFATQRDVSRTKRDIKTFELRLRCDNHDRALAVGMTAYVNLPSL